MPRSTTALVLMIGMMASSATARQPELIDRTVAIVGGQAITMSDARAAVIMSLLDPGGAGDHAEASAARLVERELILREVRRYSPPSPSEAAIEVRLQEVRARFADPQALAQALDSTGMSESRLRAWVRDDLRAQAYLAQRFAAASTPTDAGVSRAYAAQKEAFDQSGTTFEAAAPLLRQQLVAACRAALISDWVSELRRRTDVIFLQP